MGLQDILKQARQGCMLDAERAVNQAIRKHGKTLVERAVRAIEPNERGILSAALARHAAKAA